MLKNFKKKSLKVKIAIIAFIIFMIALISYVLYSTFKPEPPVAYEMSKVSYGEITDYLEVSGTVESGVSENFTAIEGVVVEEVFVNVGDKVKNGDLIATFNVSGATKYVADAKKDYDSALKDYNDAKKSTDDNAKRKAEIANEIAKLKKDIEAKEKEIAELEKKAETEKNAIEVEIPEVSLPETTLSQEQINAVVSQMKENSATEEEIKAFIESVSQIQTDVEIPDELPEFTTEPSTQDVLIQKNLELAQLKSDLSTLQAENAVTISTDNESMLENLKTIADAKKATYENVKKIYDKMKNGWYAENDGIITVVNIKAGEKFVPVKESNSSLDLSALIGDNVNVDLITSLMGDAASIPTGTGVTVESYDDMIVSVTVGKSDLLKIKVGMEAIVTSLDSEYEAEVVYVGATAADSSGSFDLNSLTSSLMGGAGGASGALVKVKINNPDEKVVIGFDVDIKIKLQTVEDVLKVPVESVIYNNGKYFVFIFDETEGTAVKRNIEKGTLDDTSYEIVSGLTEGEMVLKSPDPNMEDGTRVQNKTA